MAVTDPGNARLFQVDLLKAAGIVTVVLIHSLRPPFAPGVSPAEAQLSLITRFAVPGFLVASGYLYARALPAAPGTTWRRLRRILLPYLVASAAAQLFWLGFDGRAIAPGTLARELALASTFGPYYYVLIAAVCVLLAPLLLRLDARGLGAAVATALIAQGWCWAAPPLPVFWQLRNPLYWLAFFLAGWWLGTREPGATRRLASHRPALFAASGAGFVAMRIVGPALSGPHAVKALLLLLSVWCALCGIFTLGVGRTGEHRLVRLLSDFTYTIYLFHLFFVLPLQRLLPAAPGAFDAIAIGVPWLAGLAGPLALAAAGRALLGPRSRPILGS